MNGIQVSPYLKFHHFGLAVRQPKAAVAYFTLLGYTIGETVYDPIQNVNLMLCTHTTHPAVEVIYGGDLEGPVDNLVQRHAEGIIYHVCYETERLAEALTAFKEAGLETLCLSAPQPALLFNEFEVSFYKVLGIGLIEILERPASEARA